MRYLSVTSGIEAATVAWHPLGWEPLAFSEIEPFPCKVLAHHYPTVPNLGDMTKFHEWENYEPDLLVGGTPCQSFSIAGLRKGLDDPRGNLMLTYLGIADRYKPRWLLFENVPGLLSSNGGRDFGTFLAGLAQLGYGFAYRVLDAQYVRTDGYPHAVPQRRRRVFVVGHLGSWQRAAAVLFDTESMRGNPPPRREAGKTVAGTIGSRTTGGGGLGTDFDLAGGLQAVTAFDTTQITSKQNGSNPKPGDACHPLARGAHAPAICMSTGQSGAEIQEIAPTLNAAFGSKLGLDNQHIDSGAGLFVHTLNCNHEAPIAFTACDYGNDAVRDVTPTMRSLCKGADGHQSGAAGLAVAFGGNVARTLSRRHDSSPCVDRGADVIFQPDMQVRRLTPLECHRLQGFPDNYLHQVHGASDTQMYKALGNSMACNVMQLIGARIATVDAL